ncbi:MAG TPA: nickel insertion protein, partial [Thermoleophilia bacterium]
MILYLDCSSGISGDMLAGALLSLAGAREADPGPLDDVLRPALAAAGIDPRLVQIEDVRRGAVAALAFKVADQPGFATFDELIVSLYASDLEHPVADAVASIAERMAAAEAEVHGRGEDEEHLHELSDVDTAVDLICAA